MSIPPEPRPGVGASASAGAADSALCTLLQQLRRNKKLSYDTLGQTPGLSRGTALNYITKPGHRRDAQTLQLLLTALGASRQERAYALQLHHQTLPEPVDPVTTAWLARARAAACTVWGMGEFGPSAARVRTAIGRPGPAERPADAPPPAYVPRDHDPDLHTDITAAAAGKLQALIVLRGSSSTGKTRSLYEAVHTLCAGWTVIRPRDAAAARGLAGAGLFDRPVVVWLNELQEFLGPNGQGLTTHLLDDLHAAAQAPLIVVGTLWPDKATSLTGGGRDDSRSEARDLLTTATRWHDVAPALTPKEQASARDLAARDLAAGDPRLARALEDPDQVGFTQTLAGAYELLEHYRNAPTMARLLLHAAADARRLGHTHPLTAALLAAAAMALWRHDRGRASPPAEWFDTALGYATESLRSDDGVRALIPLDNTTATITAGATAATTTGGIGAGDVGPVEYDLADYLEEHLTRTRTAVPVSDLFWAALPVHVTHPEDLLALARAAATRAHHPHAEALYRAAAATGAPNARTWLAGWLSRQPGRAAETKQAYRDAVAAGDPKARTWLVDWLDWQPGRQAEVEQAYRDAVAAGDPDAPVWLAAWLGGQPGREADVEQVYRDAVTAGNPYGRTLLAGWLDGQVGRETEVEQVYRDAVAAGDPDARPRLAGWLARQPGREADVEQAWRDAVAADDPDSRMPGRN